MKTIDFDCNGNQEPIDVVVTLSSFDYEGKWADPEDGDQMVSIVHFTPEGLLVDFFQDGELVRTVGRTWEEWFDSAQQA